jgi:carnitine 3-dehydrogenase
MSNATTARQRAETDWPQENALLTLEVVVRESWIDYNDHMTEWQYYKVLSDACENFLTAIGFTETYRGRGFSFFSVEGHLRNLRECRLGTALKVYTEVIGADSFRFHIYQYIVDVSRNIVVATGEHMLLHIDLTTRKHVKAGPYMQDCMQEAASRWKAPLLPKGASPSFRVLSAAAVGSGADENPVGL